jgi:uncharacterized protein
VGSCAIAAICCMIATASLADDDENVRIIVSIFALAHEHDPDPEMRSYDKLVSPELREKLIIGVAAGVMIIY